jgi:phosphoheptose isomerase
MSQTPYHQALAEHHRLFDAWAALEPSVTRIGARLGAALQTGCKIMFCGNRGSATCGQHLA